ncbi:MAG TPA: SxtJ family membrane protein [Burkholderiales bacterium]|nr:SxtJ family membrane protein [Burkholderiales bacterium]
MTQATLPESALPSDRKFGWTFAALFVLIGAISHPWLIALGALFAVVTVTRAQLLAPLKRAWMKLAELLNRVVSPVVMAVIFFVIFTPVALVMRAMGRDALCRRYEPQAPTYWKQREPPGPAEDSFRNLF